MTPNVFFRQFLLSLAFFVGACSLAQAVHAQESPNGDTLVFSIPTFDVQGPELIPRSQVLALLAAYTGRPLTFSELRQATAQVERLHAVAGFEVVRVIVPEQEIESGSPLRLQIVDARLDKLTVTGNQFFSTELIQKNLRVLQPQALINTIEMDKNLRLINENPALAVRVNLEPSSKPALVDADVKVVDQKPLAAYVTLDNTGTHATGDYRLGFVLQHNNVFKRGHMLSLQTVTSPGHWSDVEVYGLNYKLPFFGLNGMLELAYTDSNVNAGQFSVGTSSLGVQGAGTTTTLKWTQWLARLAGMDQRVFVSHEHKQFVSQVLLNNAGSSLAPDLQSDPVSVGYLLSDEQDTRQRQMLWVYSKNYVRGGQNSDAQYALSNPASKAGFDVLKFNGSWSDQIFANWRFTAALDAQWSRASLISGEQFGAGGIYSVRGFDERAVSGDAGLRQSLELLGPNLASVFGTVFERLQLAGFLEAAQLRNNNASAGVASETRILSYGAGARFAFAPGQQIRLDLARVVSGAVGEPHGDTKLHFTFASAL